MSGGVSSGAECLDQDQQWILDRADAGAQCSGVIGSAKKFFGKLVRAGGENSGRRRPALSRDTMAAGLGLLLVSVHGLGYSQKRPAPPPSRYGYSLKVDAASLPAGVKLREVRDELGTRYFISNAGDRPLVINERFQNDVLAAGTKLVSGKVYQYFPTGVPMEGKTHLKGWQAPFGDIPETLLFLPADPVKIYEGRQAGLSKELPPPEPFSIAAKYDGKPHEIRGTVQYHLNAAYDEFHKVKVQ